MTIIIQTTYINIYKKKAKSDLYSCFTVLFYVSHREYAIGVIGWQIISIVDDKVRSDNKKVL
jgi:hypothetical protein